jgi:hypothetical protein
MAVSIPRSRKCRVAATWPHFIGETSVQRSGSQSQGIVESLKEEIHDLEGTQQTGENAAG